MRGIWLGIGICLTIAACGHPPETAPNAVTASGAAGSVGEIALRGQVVVTRPPDSEAAVAEVRREAAMRCPGGFAIRSLHTTDVPPVSDFLYRLENYQAVVDCNPPPSYGGAR